jgi:hypothetical protein
LPAGFGASDAGAGLPAGAAGHPSGPAALAWVVSSDTLALAAGREPLVTLRVGQKPEQGLGDEPVIARALAPLGDTASAVVLAQPLKFDATRAHLPTAPVVVAVGRREKDGYVHVGVGFGVLREVARRQMGL